ncbi:hypothetical protein [Mycobacterium sp.]|uniref:hypothetical protein n=1 Tax=Mycobacterium sp. TaxID=1785 RepID=UPI0025CFD6F8|nr:hypothetical protein [Mycobacterium sp.]
MRSFLQNLPRPANAQGTEAEPGEQSGTRRWTPRAWRSTAWGAARWQLAIAAAATVLIVAPQSSADAGVGIDPSWEAVVAMAPSRHIAWGPGLVFTYGPLGYLQTTAYYSFGQSVLATIYQFAIVAALFLGLTAALRLRYAPTTSIAAAFLTTALAAALQVGHGSSLGLMYPELAVLAALVWAVMPTLQEDRKRSTVFVTCTVLGAVAGLQLLVKLNTGFAIFAIALVMSLLLGWKRIERHLATVAAFVVSTLSCWLIAGQQLRDFPAWLKFSAAVVSGYSEAQSEPLMPTAVPAVLLTLAWLGCICLLFVRNAPGTPRTFVVLVGFVSVVMAKSAFGRFDVWHYGILLGTIIVVVAVTPRFRARHRVFIATAVLVVFATVTGPGGVIDRAVAVVQGPEQSIERLVTLAVPGGVQRRAERAKAQQRQRDGVPQRFIETIGTKTVHVDPDETSVAWAYNLTWQPTPVFATYSAYTPSLDRLNADSLVNGPEYVLSRVSTSLPAKGIDGRLGTQESPLYSRALLCNYTLTAAENHWALFTRTAPHCGAVTPLAQFDLNNNTVTSPAPSAPNMAVMVGIDLDPAFVHRFFQGAVAPLGFFTLVLDGADYRLIAANAAEPFLVSTPSSVSGSNLEIHAHSIGIGHTLPLVKAGVHARLRFYEMPVDSVPGGGF